MHGDPTTLDAGGSIDRTQGLVGLHILGPVQHVGRVLKVFFSLEQSGGLFGFEIIHHDPNCIALIGQSGHGQLGQFFSVGRKGWSGAQKHGKSHRIKRGTIEQLPQ